MLKLTGRFTTIAMASLVVFVSAATLSPVNASAHEMWPGYPHSWDITSAVNGVTRANLSVCDTLLTGTPWGNVFSTAISNWNNYSNNKVSCSDVSGVYYPGGIHGNDAFIAFDASWSASSFEYNFGYNTLGVTLMTNIDTHPNNICFYDTSITACAKQVNLATIRLNPKNTYQLDDGTYYALTSADRVHTMVHEIGHTLGLGHPASSVTSIMNQGVNLGIVTPQAHDTADLAAFYP